MGMFDDIRCSAMRCPLCGATMGWQSKDAGCALDKLTVHELLDQGGETVTFYSDCEECSIWVDVTVKRQLGRWTRKQNQQYLLDKWTPPPAAAPERDDE